MTYSNTLFIQPWMFNESLMTPFLWNPATTTGDINLPFFVTKGYALKKLNLLDFLKILHYHSPEPPKESVPFTPSWVGKDMVIPIKWRCHRSYNRWIIWKPKKWARRNRPDVSLNIEPNKKKSRWCFRIFLEFPHRSLGKWNPLWLVHIFQMGWWTNHQQKNCMAVSKKR